MAREKGSMVLPSNIELGTDAPLDARTVVETKADLTVAANFEHPYEGLPVYVAAEKKYYVLTALPVTSAANWKALEGGGGGTPEWDDILNKPDDLVEDADYVHTDNNYTNADKAKLDTVNTTLDVNVTQHTSAYETVDASFTNGSDTVDIYYARNPEEGEIMMGSLSLNVNGDDSFPIATKWDISLLEDGKQDKLTAGQNISIVKDTQTGETVISATGDVSVAWDEITGKPADLVQDTDYVHTDNNFSDAEKEKIARAQSAITTIEDAIGNLEDLTTEDRSSLVAALEETRLTASEADRLLGEELLKKQDKLTAGDGITIEGDVISATGMEVPIDSTLSPTSVNPVQNKAITVEVVSIQSAITTIEAAQNKLSGSVAKLEVDFDAAQSAITTIEEAIDRLDAEKADASSVVAMQSSIDVLDAAIVRLDVEKAAQSSIVTIQSSITTIQTALADRYTKTETDAKIAEAMTDVDNEHFHVVTVLPDAADAKENHEYVLVTYEPGTTTIATEVHYLFYDGEYHQRTTTVSLDGYATEQYVDDAFGEHVKTDVPVGALFTDTVYDDTALAARVTTNEEGVAANTEAMNDLLGRTYQVKGSYNSLIQDCDEFIYPNSSSAMYRVFMLSLATKGSRNVIDYCYEISFNDGSDSVLVWLNVSEYKFIFGTNVTSRETYEAKGRDGNLVCYFYEVYRSSSNGAWGIYFVAPDKNYSAGGSSETLGNRIAQIEAYEPITIYNVSKYVNEDFDLAETATHADVATGVAEAKAYADGKTLSATGWGVVTTGRGEIGSAGNPKVIDVSQYNFASADDYEVAVTSLNNNCNVACTAKTATSFTVVGSGWGQSVGERPFSYVLTAKGYGAVAYTGALPEGGTAGQALVKRSGDDGDVAWADAGGGTVDQTYNATSTNAQSGTAVAGAVATKQDALTAGLGAKIENNEISFNYVTAGRKAVAYAGQYSKSSGSFDIGYGYDSTEYIDITEMRFADINDYAVEVAGSNGNIYVSEDETSKSFGFSISVNIYDNRADVIPIAVSVTKETNRIVVRTYTTKTATRGYSGSFSYSFVYKVYYTGVHVDGSIPTGGTTGQALVKKSDADGDVEWKDASGTVTFDDTMSDTSENGVKNKVIKSYVDNKTLNPTGWGVAKIGQVSLSSTTEVTVDITDLGFMSVDDYEVFLTLNDATTTNVVPRVSNKTLTSFTVKKNSTGSNVPVNYVVIGKGYGGGSSYRDLILDTAMSNTSENGVENKVIKAYVDSMVSVDDALDTTSTHAVQNKVITEKVNDLQSQIGNLGEPFRVKQFQTVIDATLPMVTEEVANTAIPNIDLTIDDTEGADYQIAGMLSYEVFDAETGGNRINCFPVCQFTMNSQKTIRIRMMCGGTARKTAKRISAWVLLKHR